MYVHVGTPVQVCVPNRIKHSDGMDQFVHNSVCADKLRVFY